MLSVEQIRSQATIFQWNARGLRSRLSDFRQFCHKYRFPVIALSESNIASDFRLSGYEVFYSTRGTAPSRVLVAVRKDLSYISHALPPDANNEYVALTAKNDRCTFTIIAAYIPPNTQFNTLRINSIIESTPPPHILTGDFNAYHPLWGSVKTTIRGTSLATLTHQHDLFLLNDGSPTFFRGTTVSSCLDLTFASVGLSHSVTWFADIECHGSDHIPTYTLLKGFGSNNKSSPIRRTD